MKLKQRLGVALSLMVGAITMYLLLNVMSFQQVSNMVEGVDVHKQERVLQSFHSHSEDRESNSVSNLLQALQNFAKLSSGPHEAISKNQDWTKDVVRKLLQDKSFNTSENVDNFIGVGKLLNEYFHPDKPKELLVHSNLSITLHKTDKPVTEHVPNKKTVDDTASDTNPFPVFNLNGEAFLTLTRFISQHAEKHKALKRRLKTPLSFRLHKGTILHNWQRWQNGINQNHVYDESSPLLENILRDLSHAEITGLSTLPDYGTQIKLVFKFSDGSQGLFKPMRWKRDQERDPNLYYFDDFERHQAEIAAFHLDRVMQFYRVPPNSGRLINITSTIEPFAARSLKRTMYISPGGNKCFYGKCDYYCDSGHPVCGHPDVIEGSMASWLPFGKGTSKKSWENPWRRSYSKFRKAAWETDPSYCDTIKHSVPYNTGRRLLDLMDITIFDYLAGNQDRHHYHTFKVFGNQSSPVLYDNGRGFGWMYHDDHSILVPVVQCCRIRHSTLAKLIRYEAGPDKLSVLMRRSLARDPVSSGPHGLVLHEGHLTALDRRVSKVLDTIWNCVRQHKASAVIHDDGY